MMMWGHFSFLKRLKDVFETVKLWFQADNKRLWFLRDIFDTDSIPAEKSGQN